MSGFVAIINIDGAPVDCALLEQLTDSLRFRGPDRQKIWIGGHVGFGHTLFQTTDEAQYEQLPFSLEGDVWITGSIRLDARIDLLNALGLQSAIHLKNTPDSTLILHAYRVWGRECLEHLQGDFAFVIWDGRNKTLLSARDHFGMRQLYYAQIGQCCIVSNSLSCIQQHPAVSGQLDDRAMGGFLLFGDQSWLNKELTVYGDIKSLLPAHSLVLDHKKIVIKKYWEIPTHVPLLRYKKESDYLEHFHEVFQRAIVDRLRTRNGVISMSGGMDSSSIAAILCGIREKESSPLDLNAVTVIYSKLHPCQEHYFTDLVAGRLKLPIQYVDGDQYPFLSRTVATTRPMEILQPLLWLDTLRLQSRSGRVVLTGAAADNLFSYPASITASMTGSPCKVILEILRLRKRYGKAPGLGTGLLKKFQNGWLKHGNTAVTPYPYPIWFNKEFEKRLALKECWAERWASHEGIAAFRSRKSLLHKSLIVPDWCADDMVMKSDFTIPEQRDPYLDLRMVEFTLSLPALPWLFNKHILRRAMREILPVQIIERPKTPLGMLHHSLLKDAHVQLVDEWQAVPEIASYVERSKIPKLAGKSCDAVLSYVNLRPLLLNR